MTTERRYFGTDGVRGVVGETLTESLVARLGLAFARWAAGAPVLLGRDTRGSGPALEQALAGGLAAGGSVARSGGILPTPAVALLAGEGCGGVVSASHNPPEHNGVKFFRPGGWKLADEDERAVEDVLVELEGEPEPGPRAPALDESYRVRYEDLVVERFGLPLAGLRIACDCANGALSGVAPRVLARLGAAVTAVGNDPDGTNINVGCGATELTLLEGVVASGDFDLGVAFDGDGDRMLAVDSAARRIDGDQIIAILALHLGVELVAVTSMTNLGFHRLMGEHGIRVVTTDVGDRYVLDALRREGGTLGGEQSGHLVYLRGHCTGDGLVAALLLARALVETGRPLAELAGVMPRFPQAQASVPVREKRIPEAVRREVELLNESLGVRGRVLVRPSGTEPVVRVLAEAEDEAAAASLCGKVSALVQRKLG